MDRKELYCTVSIFYRAGNMVDEVPVQNPWACSPDETRFDVTMMADGMAGGVRGYATALV